VITDLGLNPVQGATGVPELFEPNPNRAAALDNLKRRCEMYANSGLKRVYATTGTNKKITEDDYKAGPENIREAGDVAKQFDMSLRIEFLRTSPFISTLPTILKMTRTAAHPNVAPMLDCYHVHFQDVPDMPHELLDSATRIIPGDGVSPLTRILGKLSEKGYAGPLSVELFLPKFQQGDPYEVAREIRVKSEAVMRQAGVM
jgi:2-keto-myo-inositol isomerase